MRFGLLLACLCISYFSLGQPIENGCVIGYSKQKNEIIETKWSSFIKQGQSRIMSEDTLVLPVVFHIIHQNGPENISDNAVLNALDRLNEAFANAGGYDQGSGVNTHIRFCLVKQDPDGNFTSGINHVYTDLPEIIPSIHDGFLKSLINWDTERFINIWVVKEITAEFSEQVCGGRISDIAGYATLPTSHGSINDGIVVESKSMNTVIHEMGHYLGLFHTFSGGCSNADCTTDGDMVCDTPPQLLSGARCDGTSNTCNTDVLSGFSSDQNDLPFNFMDYSSCPHDFTPGQKERMRFMILNVRNSLLTQTTCEQICTTPAKADFSFLTGPFVTGSAIHFTNISNGDFFEWRINDQLISTSSDLDYTFPHQGWFKIELLAGSSAGNQCSNRQVNWIQVFCSVKSRISANKKKVAIDEDVQLSSSILELTPVNTAIAFEWYANGELIGNQSTITHRFQTAGEKIIYLITKKGACTDTSDYKLAIVKPFPDYTLSLDELACNGSENRKLIFTVCNDGDTDLPPGLPISFYDRNPTVENASLTGAVFYTNKTIERYCCESFEMELPSSFNASGTFVYGVVNDNGSLSRPYKFELFPVTIYKESDYTNNIDSLVWEPFSVRISPGDTMVLIGTVLNLTAGSNDSITVKWSTTRGQFDCDTCLSTNMTVDGYARVVATAISNAGCIASDTAYVKIFINQDIMVPSAFTPNNDNRNDRFYILGSKNVTNIRSMSIYNRWGERVFHKINFMPNIPSLGWDGRYKGRDAALATYVYYFTAEFADGTNKLYKGTIILVR